MKKYRKNKSFTFFSLRYLGIILIIFAIFATLYYYHGKKEHIQTYDSAGLEWQASGKIYTNNIGKFSITYPSTWTLKESHTLSNRVVDNPNEINTATFTGKEGEILIEWGPMGFGGGCDPKNHKMFSIKNKTMDICQGIDKQGNKYWRGIGNNHKDDSIAEVVYAEAYKPYSVNENVIEEILSTLIFN